jgi:hypothetical protein
MLITDKLSLDEELLLFMVRDLCLIVPENITTVVYTHVHYNRLPFTIIQKDEDSDECQ